MEGWAMTFPTSNVRVIPRLITLTLESFYGCDACAMGYHGTVEDGRCLCCGWDPAYRAGGRIEVSS